MDAVDPNDSTDGSDGDDEWIECLLDPNRAPKQKPKRAPRLALDAQMYVRAEILSSRSSKEHRTIVLLDYPTHLIVSHVLARFDLLRR